MIENLGKIPGTATVPDERTIRSFAKSVQLGDAGFVTSEALGGRSLHRTGDETAKDGTKSFRDGIRTNRIKAIGGTPVRLPKKTYADSVFEGVAQSRLVRRKDVTGLLEFVRNFGTVTREMEERLYATETALQIIVRACSDFEELRGMTIAQAYGIVASALVGLPVGDTDARTARSVSKKAFRSLVSNFKDGHVTALSNTSLPALVLRTASLCDRIKSVQDELGRMPKEGAYEFPPINAVAD